MIDIHEVCKTYYMGNEVVHALDEASLFIGAGEFVGVVGPSGSGKSTLMNIIGCLDTADKGEYYLDGQLIGHYSENDLAAIRNRKIGFVFQNFNLLAKLTAEQNIELPLIYQRIGLKERKERVAHALERVGLKDRSRHRPTELSGGQQQRVAVARALATEPSILLADEPTGNLDSRTGEEIIALFEALNREGNTVVLITHDDRVAAKTHRIVRILDGKIFEK